MDEALALCLPTQFYFLTGRQRTEGKKTKKSKTEKKGERIRRRKKSAHVDQTTLVSGVDVSFRRINLFPPLSREKKKSLLYFRQTARVALYSGF